MDGKTINEQSVSSYTHHWDFGGKNLRQLLFLNSLTESLSFCSEKLQFDTGILASMDHYVKIIISNSGNVYIKIAIIKDTSPVELGCLAYPNNTVITMTHTKTESLLKKCVAFRRLTDHEISKFQKLRICADEDPTPKQGEHSIWFRVKKSNVSKFLGKHYIRKSVLRKQNYIFSLDFSIKIFDHNPYSNNTQNVQSNCNLETQQSTNLASSSLTNSHSKLKSRHLSTEKLFMSAEFSDLEIRCGDKSFPVHKVILANMSPVFAALFQEPLIELHGECLTITEFDADTVEQFIKFLYTGQISMDEYATKLFFISEKYAVDDLKELTTDVLISKVNNDNFLDFYQIAKSMNSQIMMNRCFQIFKSKKNDLIKTPDDVKKFSEEYPELMLQLSRSLVL